MTEEKYSLGVLDTPQKKDDFIKYMIQDYSKKDSHKEQSDLPDRCFSVVIDNDGSEIIFTDKHDNDDDLINDLIETYPQTYSTNIMNVLQQAQQKSIETKKPSFIQISFLKHNFALSVFNNKICILDSLNTIFGKIFVELLEKINTNKQLNLNIKKIDTKQQTDYESCPYFTASNITKLDKLFHENPEEFCKLINIEKDIVIPPLFVINTTQSLTGIEKQTGLIFKKILNTDDIEIEKLTSSEKIDVVPINNDDTIVLDNFFSEKVAINKSNSKINLTDEDLNKMIKYFTYKEHTNQYGKTENKLQNLRVSYKSRDMLIKFLEANKDFTQQEEVAQSPAK